MRKTTLIILSIAAFANAFAQKLPNTQQVSLRAPANLKIDGKATEWGNQFKAYNNATDVYYTLSNDDENLYLCLVAKQYSSLSKIARTGVRFTVNHSTSKKDTSPVVITYPALARADRSALAGLFETRNFEGVKVPIDHSAEALNKLLRTKSKLIKVEGVKDIDADNLSIYNDKGITSASEFGGPSLYTYELAIPLKYLNLNKDQPAFSYQIKLNYVDEKEEAAFRASQPPPPPNTIMLQPVLSYIAVTDFWGEYTLAK
jgi:hypothetical protein